MSTTQAVFQMPGWASKDPLKLCPCVRAKFLTFMETCKAANIDVAVIETARDLERQKYYRAIGTTRTLKSLHLPQPPRGKSLAFDVCPKAYLRIKGWFPMGPLWRNLAILGNARGLTWGGDWKKGDDGWRDLSHFYLDRCECPEAA